MEIVPQKAERTRADCHPPLQTISTLFIHTFNYKPFGEVIDTLYGERSCLIVYEKSQSYKKVNDMKKYGYGAKTWYNYDVVAMSSGRYKLPGKPYIIQSTLYDLDEEGLVTANNTGKTTVTVVSTATPRGTISARDSCVVEVVPEEVSNGVPAIQE